MKICIIGGSGHTKYGVDGAVKSGYTICAIAPGSINENMSKAQKACEKYEISPVFYENYIEMLDTEKPDIAVVNCHFGDHADIILQCVHRKIHVFAEKPVSTTLEKLEEIKLALSKYDVKLCAMLALRYAPWVLSAKDAIDNGRIGKIKMVIAQKSYKLGNREDFYKKRESYGGTIPWVSLHGIDWVYFLTGKKKFKTVYSSHTASDNGSNGDIEISCMSSFTMEDNISACVHADYLRPQTAAAQADDRVIVIGTKGRIEARDGVSRILADGMENFEELPKITGNQIFADFISEIEGRGKCMVTLDDSLYVTKVALLARESADNNKLISID